MRKQIRLSLIISGMLLLSGSAWAQAEEIERAARLARDALKRDDFLEKLNAQHRQIHAAVQASTVDISVFDFSKEGGLVAGSGAGWVYSEDGYIVTASHVVLNKKDALVYCRFNGMDDAYPAVVVGIEPEIDVAVLKIEREDLLAIEFGNDLELRPGDQVFTFGSPLGLNFSMSRGIVAATGRRAALQPRVIQVDGDMNPGNSGGPLVGVNGELLGMVLAIQTLTTQSAGISFVAPNSVVLPIVEQLIRYGEPRAGDLGIVWYDNQLANTYASTQAGFSTAEGVLVRRVKPESAAQRGGIQPKDLIISVGGMPVKDPLDLRVALKLFQAGEEIEIEYRRGDSYEMIVAQLDELPMESEVQVATNSSERTKD